MAAHWPGWISAACGCPLTLMLMPFDQPGTRSLSGNVAGCSIDSLSVLLPISGYCVVCTSLTGPAGPFHSTSEGR